MEKKRSAKSVLIEFNKQHGLTSQYIKMAKVQETNENRAKQTLKTSYIQSQLHYAKVSLEDKMALSDFEQLAYKEIQGNNGSQYRHKTIQEFTTRHLKQGQMAFEKEFLSTKCHMGPPQLIDDRLNKLNIAAEQQSKNIAQENPIPATYLLHKKLHEIKSARQKRANTTVNQFQNVDVPQTFFQVKDNQSGEPSIKDQYDQKTLITMFKELYSAGDSDSNPYEPEVFKVMDPNWVPLSQDLRAVFKSEKSLNQLVVLIRMKLKMNQKEDQLIRFLIQRILPNTFANFRDGECSLDTIMQRVLCKSSSDKNILIGRERVADFCKLGERTLNKSCRGGTSKDTGKEQGEVKEEKIQKKVQISDDVLKKDETDNKSKETSSEQQDQENVHSNRTKSKYTLRKKVPYSVLGPWAHSELSKEYLFLKLIQENENSGPCFINKTHEEIIEVMGLTNSIKQNPQRLTKNSGARKSQDVMKLLLGPKKKRPFEIRNPNPEQLKQQQSSSSSCFVPTQTPNLESLNKSVEIRVGGLSMNITNNQSQEQHDADVSDSHTVKGTTMKSENVKQQHFQVGIGAECSSQPDNSTIHSFHPIKQKTLKSSIQVKMAKQQGPIIQRIARPSTGTPYVNLRHQKGQSQLMNSSSKDLSIKHTLASSSVSGLGQRSCSLQMTSNEILDVKRQFDQLKIPGRDPKQGQSIQILPRSNPSIVIPNRQIQGRKRRYSPKNRNAQSSVAPLKCNHSKGHSGALNNFNDLISMSSCMDSSIVRSKIGAKQTQHVQNLDVLIQGGSGASPNTKNETCSLLVMGWQPYTQATNQQNVSHQQSTYSRLCQGFDNASVQQSDNKQQIGLNTLSDSVIGQKQTISQEKIPKIHQSSRQDDQEFTGRSAALVWHSKLNGSHDNSSHTGKEI